MSELHEAWTVTVSVTGTISVEISANKPITAEEAHAIAKRWVAGDDDVLDTADCEEIHRELEVPETEAPVLHPAPWLDGRTLKS